jgi:hypothetical protein
VKRDWAQVLGDGLELNLIDETKPNYCGLETSRNDTQCMMKWMKFLREGSHFRTCQL